MAAVSAVAAGLVIALAIGVPVGLLTRGHQPAPASGPSATPVPTSSAARAEATAAYRQALAAMRGSSGFKYVADTTGIESQHIDGDAGSSAGRQAITFNATYGAEQFTLLLAGTTVYFEGNAPAIEDQLGVSAAAAPSLDGKWISVSAGDGPYSVLQPGITVADQAQELALVPASTARVSAGGVSAIRITGTVPQQQGVPAATGHVDVAADSHLPIAYATTLTFGGRTVTTTTTFANWGTTPSVSAPSGAVAWSTLGATQPPGGYGGGGGNPGPSPTPQGSI